VTLLFQYRFYLVACCVRKVNQPRPCRNNNSFVPSAKYNKCISSRSRPSVPQHKMTRYLGTERYLQNRTEFFFLSFPLLLCLKLVADASPHHGAGTTFHTRPPSCLWPDPKDLIASNTSIDLIKPLGSGHFSTWNELDAILPPPRRRHGK
jgi:hypothetical protein